MIILAFKSIKIDEKFDPIIAEARWILALNERSCSMSGGKTCLVYENSSGMFFACIHKCRLNVRPFDPSSDDGRDIIWQCRIKEFGYIDKER